MLNYAVTSHLLILEGSLPNRWHIWSRLSTICLRSSIGCWNTPGRVLCELCLFWLSLKLNSCHVGGGQTWQCQYIILHAIQSCPPKHWSTTINYPIGLSFNILGNIGVWEGGVKSSTHKWKQGHVCLDYILQLQYPFTSIPLCRVDPKTQLPLIF